MVEETSPSVSPARSLEPALASSSATSIIDSTLYRISPVAYHPSQTATTIIDSPYTPRMMSPSVSLQDEATSSRQKRLRVEEEEEEEEEEGRGVDVITTELPRNLLECPVCFHALTIPTFQCDNGHILCSSCCPKLRNICPTCKVPTGKIRSRFAESVLEASIVPCLNAKHGCTLKFHYGKEEAHEKICGFALCYCPEPNCNYTGNYKDLYNHCDYNHHINHQLNYFDFGTSHRIRMYGGMKQKVIQEFVHGPLVVVQCFKVEQGMHVAVNCIAPCAPEVEKHSYHFSYSSGNHIIKFGPVEMNRIQKVSLQNPEKGSCMIVPDCFLNEHRYVEMDICICRLVEE